MVEKKRKRPNTRQHTPRGRENIRTGMLISVLERIAEGKIKSTPQRVTATLGLLRKTLPDLSATDTTLKADNIKIIVEAFKRPGEGSHERTDAGDPAVPDPDSG